MSADAPAPVHVEADAGVLLITLNRPEARNAVDKTMAETIAATLDRFDAEDDLRVAIITGAGGTFCAGMDLKAFARGERPYAEGRGAGGITMRGPRKPIIAAVEGWAVALGFEIALSCDLIVASREARFGIPEVKRGLAAAAGGLVRLPKRIPYHVAMELALTGDPVTAERAYELGVVNRLADPGQAVGVARELAAIIAANGPLAVDAAKRVVSVAQEWTDEESWDRAGAITGPVFVSEDAMEGARAFAEKRPPQWKGR